MLRYEKISVSEGIDITRKNASKECMLCHYWYFKEVRVKFELYVCSKCHDVSTTAYELKNCNINVKGANFRCILWGISKIEAVNMLNNPVLEDKDVL